MRDPTHAPRVLPCPPLRHEHRTDFLGAMPSKPSVSDRFTDNDLPDARMNTRLTLNGPWQLLPF
jgi:hypothetical protein